MGDVLHDLITHALYFIGVITAAICFALIEIQIEGPHGWAAKLPTWRVKGTWFSRWFPNKTLTGYHLWILIFIVVVAHLPFAFGLPWSWKAECRSVAFFLFFWVIEDFCWFLLNPHYGIRRFKPEYIPWHAHHWWWLAPRDYWIGLAIAVCLYVLASQPEPEYYVAMR